MSNDATYISWTDDDRVTRWLSRAPALERQLEPVADVLFAAAALRPGERVLDVGCGTGPTTRRAARAVGPTGRVVGLDISPDMLRAAAAATPDQDGAPIEWVAADTVTWDPPAGAFDIVLSRFGVMFFSDPPAAFRRLATATRPGGRLAMAVWARRDESPVFGLPLAAAVAELRRRNTPVQVPPDDEGPFSLHDPDALATLLTTTGWTDIDSTPHRLTLALGGGTDPATAAAGIIDSGPLNPITADLSDTDRTAVTHAVATALAQHTNKAGHVQLDAQIHLVTARRPQPPPAPNLA